MRQTEIDKIRTMIADYMYSEGCSCCRGDDHKEHEKALAEFLKVPMYGDKSGYDWEPFRTKNG